MKKSILILTIIIITGTFLSCSISDSGDTGTIRINLPGSFSRSLTPEFINSLSYIIECTRPNGGEEIRTARPGQKVSIPLTVGAWTIKLIVLNADGEEIGSDTQKAVVNPGKETLVEFRIGITEPKEDTTYTVLLDTEGLFDGDSVSFDNTDSILEITASGGQTVSIYFNLIDTFDNHVLNFYINGESILMTDEVRKGTFDYELNPGHAENEVITIFAVSVHSNLILLDPPVSVTFDKNGTITFTEGGNNNAAENVTYTYTLYKNGEPVANNSNKPITRGGETIPGLVSIMLMEKGSYRISITASTTDEKYISSSTAITSNNINVYSVTVTITGGKGGDKVTINGIDHFSTFNEHFFSGTDVVLTVIPEDNNTYNWSGDGTVNTDIRTIENITSDSSVNIQFISPLTIEVSQTVNYINKDNVVTPIRVGDYTEHATITVTVRGFNNPEDAENIGVNITNVIWLEFNGHNMTGSADSFGNKVFNITVTLIDELAPTNASTNITITGLTNLIGSNYRYIGGNNISTIRLSNGKSAAENLMIPVNQENILFFNTYANTTAGLTRNYRLTENVTLPAPIEEESNWTAIGTSTDVFIGSFTGGNFTISNLFINTTEDDQGMFGYISGGKVENLKLDNCIIIGGLRVGGIAGYVIVRDTQNPGIIENCFVSGNITGSSNVGGIAGTVSNSELKRNQSSVNVTATGINTNNAIAGGVVGSLSGANYGLIEDCSASGIIKGLTSVGGIAGSITNIQNVRRLNSNVTVYGKENNIGGIAGNLTNSNIFNSTAAGTVEGDGNNVGGIAGSVSNTAARTIERTKSSANVTGNMYVGGIIGNVHNSFTVLNSYSTGNITGNDRVGGIVGKVSPGSTIINCYATGDIEHTGADSQPYDGTGGGGLVGTFFSSTLRNNVTLNSRIIRINSVPNNGRIAGLIYGDVTVANNFARNAGMTITAGGNPVTTTPDSNGIHGLNVDAALYNTQPWWENTTTGPGFLFGTADTAPWSWDTTRQLPKLWFE